MTWLDNPEKWDKLAAKLRAAGEFGIDTETYGQPDKTSPQHRTKVHCWSVGILTGTRNARGYRNAVGAVLPSDGLLRPSIRAVLEDAAIPKWAHNSPHDEHSIRNMGVEINGLQDSLQWLRVAVPGVSGYGLKDAEQWALGYPPRPSFKDMVSYEKTEAVAKAKHEKGCVCGSSPCRSRATSEWLDHELSQWRPHLRVGWKRFTVLHRQVPATYAVTDFAPDHPRWAAWLDYSLTDAVRGIELVDWLRSRKEKKVEFPWQ